MKEREIDGFIVRATTEETGEGFFEPAFRVKKVGSTYEHPQPWYATSQTVEARSEQEAQEIAERELASLRRILWQGDDWDLYWT